MLTTRTPLATKTILALSAVFAVLYTSVELKHEHARKQENLCLKKQ